MGTLENYRRIIQKILTESAQIPYAYGDIQIQTIFDCYSDTWKSTFGNQITSTYRSV